MILVTVGSQLPFDRLICSVDQWAGKHMDKEVIAQIGQSSYKPEFIKYYKFMEPDKYIDYFEKADLIISHAGMGSIISSLEYQKPILLLPRMACKGEHRNDHQFATANHFSRYENIHVMYNENELPHYIENIFAMRTRGLCNGLQDVSSELVREIRQFITR